MPESAIKKFLRMTLALAEKGRGQTSPNPMVGAVIVKNGKIVGQGYHKKAGGPHAEIIALKQAGGESKGATLYINLEPCCHFGRTNPCTDTIVEAGIREVVYAIKDPNPRMNGQGANMLKKAGLKVSGGYLREDAERLNEAYLKFIRTGRPFVTLKMAQSLDGQIATISGDSKWISGMAARRLAHRLRAENDAVVIGAGTVLTDNPCLT
ncbi:MAG: bifunctional diaminohydroxyphosphoribosylaminopyrimidine deaminase/5-amino-6-(5-phosphoribosylamino)uracil reductase RibD, partial [candidate division Zixibacteria bacterium]|nr:bifunctional diaminohydroxyphosphoribosylaminopyrimidine deaminase/5-amino-6-(5-phosphoribosylamino)uracil reductase RibD [candidate division Zixibacteria bacterium]